MTRRSRENSDSFLSCARKSLSVPTSPPPSSRPRIGSEVNSGRDQRPITTRPVPAAGALPLPARPERASAPSRGRVGGGGRSSPPASPAGARQRAEPGPRRSAARSPASALPRIGGGEAAAALPATPHRRHPRAWPTAVRFNLIRHRYNARSICALGIFAGGGSGSARVWIDFACIRLARTRRANVSGLATAFWAACAMRTNR